MNDKSTLFAKGGLIFKSCLLLAALSCLSACAIRPLEPGIDKADLWEGFQRRLNTIQTWQMKGRIAVRLEKEGWSAGLYWRQEQRRYLLRILAPFGRGTFELSGNAEGVVLRTAEDKIYYAATPEALLQENLGWHVPISGLLYWIKGLPQPDIEIYALLLDEKGRIQELRQSGWEVSYKSYVSEDGVDLPAKLSLHNNKLNLRLIVHQWELSP